MKNYTEFCAIYDKSDLGGEAILAVRNDHSLPIFVIIKTDDAEYELSSEEARTMAQGLLDAADMADSAWPEAEDFDGEEENTEE